MSPFPETCIEVRSAGTGSTVYQVTITAEGTARCTCPAFGKHPLPCPHVRDVLGDLAEAMGMERPPEPEAPLGAPGPEEWVAAEAELSAARLAGDRDGTTAATHRLQVLRWREVEAERGDLPEPELLPDGRPVGSPAWHRAVADYTIAQQTLDAAGADLARAHLEELAEAGEHLVPPPPLEDPVWVQESEDTWRRVMPA